MTREEAIKRLGKYVHNSCYTIEHQEACAMAIAALREQKERSKGCDGCIYKGKRHQKCSCCQRNRYLKDCYVTEDEKA